MKIIVVILLLLSASDAFAVTDYDLHKVDALIKVYPNHRRDAALKKEFPQLWIMSYHERAKLIERRPELPKYYKDPKHGSNGGYTLA